MASFNSSRVILPKVSILTLPRMFMPAPWMTSTFTLPLYPGPRLARLVRRQAHCALCHGRLSQNSMQLKDVMTRQVEVISPDATLEEAARKMDDLNVGPLPVWDGEHLVGLITDRDITVRATAAGKDPRTTPVSEAMSREVLYCFEDQDVSEAARLMEEQ